MRDKYCQKEEHSVSSSAENCKRKLGLKCVERAAQSFLRRDPFIVPIKPKQAQC